MGAVNKAKKGSHPSKSSGPSSLGPKTARLQKIVQVLLTTSPGKGAPASPIPGTGILDLIVPLLSLISEEQVDEIVDGLREAIKQYDAEVEKEMGMEPRALEEAIP